jgi:methylthioribose-1-phosphate isomerase
MNKKLIVFGLAAIVFIAGCGRQSDQQDGQGTESSTMSQKVEQAKQAVAKTADEAINISKKIDELQAQKDYLISQAETFYKSEDFQQAMEVAQYVVQYLDKDSAKAKDLLEKAKAKLSKMAESKVNEVTQSLGGLGN